MPPLTPIAFQKLYVEPVLWHLNDPVPSEGIGRSGSTIPYSSEAVQLIVGIAAHESGDFEHVQQIGGGPALGYGQSEPTTHNDVWVNWLAYRRDLARKVWELSSETPFTRIPDEEELIWNHGYMVAIMRCILRRAPGALPAVGDYQSQAVYWKDHYNTHLGKGVVGEYVNRAARIFSNGTV